MSDILSSPFKKPTCEDMHQSGVSKVQAHLRDSLGGLINLQVVGTDPDIVGTVDVSALGTDYVPAAGNVNPDGTFFIIPETSGVFVVALADGTQFTITAVQSAAYLGQVYPARIIRVLEAGTTGVFSVVW